MHHFVRLAVRQRVVLVGQLRLHGRELVHLHLQQLARRVVLRRHAREIERTRRGQQACERDACCQRRDAHLVCPHRHLSWIQPSLQQQPLLLTHTHTRTLGDGDGEYSLLVSTHSHVLAVEYRSRVGASSSLPRSLALRARARARSWCSPAVCGVAAQSHHSPLARSLARTQARAHSKEGATQWLCVCVTHTRPCIHM